MSPLGYKKISTNRNKESFLNNLRWEELLQSPSLLYKPADPETTQESEVNTQPATVTQSVRQFVTDIKLY